LSIWDFHENAHRHFSLHVGLYEEPDRPLNALGYIKQYLGAPSNVDVEGLRRENEDLKRQVEKLRKQAAEKS